MLRSPVALFLLLESIIFWDFKLYDVVWYNSIDKKQVSNKIKSWTMINANYKRKEWYNIMSIQALLDYPF